jgi:hypothetical protein
VSLRLDRDRGWQNLDLEMSDSNHFEQLQLISEDCSNLPISSFVSTFVISSLFADCAMKANLPIRLQFDDLIVTIVLPPLPKSAKFEAHSRLATHVLRTMGSNFPIVTTSHSSTIERCLPSVIGQCTHE